MQLRHAEHWVRQHSFGLMQVACETFRDSRGRVHFDASKHVLASSEHMRGG